MEFFPCSTIVSFIPFLVFGIAHLALQNVNKDYIFLYFHNFVAKSDQKAKTENGMNETQVSLFK